MTPWLPAAWTAPSGQAADADAAGDDFVAGWGGSSAPADAPAPAPNPFGALLPDFGVEPQGWNPGAGELAWAELVAQAADEREALVRAQLAAEYAADADAREAAHAAALEAAWTEGHAAGRAQGEADAGAALAASAGALDAAVSEVRAHEERWAGDLRAHVAALAVAVARHVVGREVAADDQLVAALVARAVAEFPVQEPLVARVHPDDLDALKAAWRANARAGDVRWYPDARVARGGAVVEGRERIVDGRVDTALERLYRAVGGHVA